MNGCIYGSVTCTEQIRGKLSISRESQVSAEQYSGSNRLTVIDYTYMTLCAVRGLLQSPMSFTLGWAHDNCLALQLHHLMSRQNVDLVDAGGALSAQIHVAAGAEARCGALLCKIHQVRQIQQVRDQSEGKE